MQYLKQTDILGLSRQVVLTLPERHSFIWTNENISFDRSDLDREVALRILPLIKAGMTKGEVELRRVHWSEFAEGEETAKGVGNLTFVWEAQLPWWDPRNDRWWEAPFCVPTNLHPDSRWILGMSS